ncbi:chorion class B protein PC10-like [Bicyclus anynana]|uniref:Chorion class B protein PC10-like n=1 Tax=Bicyclus anynana TaxID=110368 RepID=A0A6J1P335_BICAN|nr:chorion class B protein PC10-like [Bicyclus anynana]
MVAKAVLLFCAQAFLAQSISSQYLPFAAPWNAPYIAEAPLAAPWAAAPCSAAPCSVPLVEEWAAFRPAASNGGGFAVTSVSPMAVTGITMKSDNAYEGPLTVTGAVPFLAAVALEGALPTAGTGAITYGCGNGNVAMLSEDINTYPGPYGYPPLGYEGHGYNRPCGCGAHY